MSHYPAVARHLDRLRRVHELIKYKRTGDPATLARRLDLSQSACYSLLRELKLMGAPVHYNKVRGSYEYQTPVELMLGFYPPSQSQPS